MAELEADVKHSGPTAYNGLYIIEGRNGRNLMLLTTFYSIKTDASIKTRRCILEKSRLFDFSRRHSRWEQMFFGVFFFFFSPVGFSWLIGDNCPQNLVNNLQITFSASEKNSEALVAPLNASLLLLLQTI